MKKMMGMDANKGGKDPTGDDAALMTPRMIPDFQLLGRDDSGGGDWQPYNGQFGDGGFVTGSKAHLSVKGGDEDTMDGDEQDSTTKARMKSNQGMKSPASSTRMAKM